MKQLKDCIKRPLGIALGLRDAEGVQIYLRYRKMFHFYSHLKVSLHLIRMFQLFSVVCLFGSFAA